jgi:hypothetical protein
VTWRQAGGGGKVADMLEQLADQLNDNMGPVSVVGSGAVLAGLDLAGVIEQMPSKALAFLVVGLFGVILFFVRRDYGRINASIDNNTKAIQLGDKRADERHTQLQRELGECVKHTDAAKSFSRVHAKLNRISSRVTVLETKEGMHDDAPPADDEPEDEGEPA